MFCVSTFWKALVPFFYGTLTGAHTTTQQNKNAILLNRNACYLFIYEHSNIDNETHMGEFDIIAFLGYAFIPNPRKPAYSTIE